MLYGIILESARDGICLFYGVETWKRVVEEVNLPQDTFNFVGQYDDSILKQIAENSKGYWNKLIYDDTSCLKASTPIYNDSFSVFIMIKDRFSYRQTLKNFIHILYNNSKQFKNQPELVLFDFNSHIPVQIPSPYNNISKYPHIKLIRFDCL
ncbi:unnamed protein product, partial [Didymodactylos carnosus]